MRPKADWLQKSQVFLIRGWRFDCHIGAGSSVVEAYCGVGRLRQLRGTIPKPTNRAGWLYRSTSSTLLTNSAQLFSSLRPFIWNVGAAAPFDISGPGS